ncbi:MAG: hypothetical protein AVDCRST_MAG50-632 [uncultured Acidimicrobiales bacterium]|uniref:Uncharacterized protein n=1 Tax=uncultured Acidimicrobiales bacterium TaxID=310071 RepID=A0A6J4HFM7_9ACTN|nr:MAG: hypothetical protein AVDCRST_MAG50-632 [uncultured Acidimicrobiales bacterium]
MPETTAPAAPGPEHGQGLVPTRVLVLGMAHQDGTIRADELLPVAEACGQTPEQVRSCLRRLVSEGLFARSGTGRGAVLRATELGMSVLEARVERTRLAYAQDAAGRGWDRQWRLVAFAVPERDRAARDAFRDRLIELGGAAVQGGLYVSPHPWHRDVSAEADRLDIRDVVTLATSDDLEMGGDRDPRRLARSLWPIEDVSRRYERFLARFDRHLTYLEALKAQHEPLADATFLPGALAMGVAFEACFETDPLLPPELLPRPWAGRAARELLIRSRRLALSLRRGQGRAGLFRTVYDDALESIA